MRYWKLLLVVLLGLACPTAWAVTPTAPTIKRPTSSISTSLNPTVFWGGTLDTDPAYSDDEAFPAGQDNYQIQYEVEIGQDDDQVGPGSCTAADFSALYYTSTVGGAVRTSVGFAHMVREDATDEYAGDFITGGISALETDTNGVNYCVRVRVRGWTGAALTDWSAFSGIVSFTTISRNSTTLYASPTGSNSSANNCQTQGSPCSLGRVLAAESAGNTVLFASGTYDVANSCGLSCSCTGGTNPGTGCDAGTECTGGGTCTENSIGVGVWLRGAESNFAVPVAYANRPRLRRTANSGDIAQSSWNNLDGVVFEDLIIQGSDGIGSDTDGSCTNCGDDAGVSDWICTCNAAGGGGPCIQDSDCPGGSCSGATGSEDDDCADPATYQWATSGSDYLVLKNVDLLWNVTILWDTSIGVTFDNVRYEEEPPYKHLTDTPNEDRAPSHAIGFNAGVDGLTARRLVMRDCEDCFQNNAAATDLLVQDSEFQRSEGHVFRPGAGLQQRYTIRGSIFGDGPEGMLIGEQDGVSIRNLAMENNTFHVGAEACDDGEVTTIKYLAAVNNVFVASESSRAGFMLADGGNASPNCQEEAAPRGNIYDSATDRLAFAYNLVATNAVCVGGSLAGQMCAVNADCPGGGSCSPSGAAPFFGFDCEGSNGAAQCNDTAKDAGWDPVLYVTCDTTDYATLVAGPPTGGPGLVQWLSLATSCGGGVGTVNPAFTHANRKSTTVKDYLDFTPKAGSALIDAGHPQFVVPTGGGSRVDIGAIEFVAAGEGEWTWDWIWGWGITFIPFW